MPASNEHRMRVGSWLERPPQWHALQRGEPIDCGEAARDRERSVLNTRDREAYRYFLHRTGARARLSVSVCLRVPVCMQAREGGGI